MSRLMLPGGRPRARRPVPLSILWLCPAGHPDCRVTAVGKDHKILFASDPSAAGADSADFDVVVADADTPLDARAIELLVSIAPTVLLIRNEDLRFVAGAVRLGEVGALLKPVLVNDVLRAIRASARDLDPKLPPAVAKGTFRKVAELVRAGQVSTLSAAAQALGVERHTLERIVKAREGCTFRAWRRRAVIERAAAQLVATRDLSIKAAAYEAGYKSVTSFCRAFRAVMRMSPQQFRSGGHFSR